MPYEVFLVTHFLLVSYLALDSLFVHYISKNFQKADNKVSTFAIAKIAILRKFFYNKKCREVIIEQGSKCVKNIKSLCILYL
jgi:hypothetical protein